MEEFLASDMEKVTGVSRNRWVQWRERGWLSDPSVQVAKGHGTRNIWDQLDLYNITLFRKVTEMGVLRRWAADIYEQMAKMMVVKHSDKTPDYLRIKLKNTKLETEKKIWDLARYLLYFRKHTSEKGLVIFTASRILDFDKIFSGLTFPTDPIKLKNLPPEIRDEMRKKKPDLRKVIPFFTTYRESFGEFDFVHIIDLQKIKKEVDEKIEALAK